MKNFWLKILKYITPSQIDALYVCLGKGDTYRVSSGNIQQSGAGGSGKVASLYHTISGKVLGSRDSGCTDLSGGPDMGSIPPPPPARRSDDSSQQVFFFC